MDDTDEHDGDIKTNILIVDDLPEKHLTYRAILEELGQNIVEAHSGADALKKILQDDFAVVLLDVNMPGMDGLETARLIHQRKRSSSVPIIFLTAFADEVRMAEGYATGAVDYLPMPVVPGILRAKVRVFVDLYNMRKKMARQAEERAKQAITEEANRSLSFLADVSAQLGQSLDITETVRRIVRLPIPFLADIAALKFNTAMGNEHRMAVGKFVDDQIVIEELDGSGALLPDLQDAMDRVMNRSEVEFLNVQAGIVLPLPARGRTVAVLALVLNSANRDLKENDRTLAEAYSFRAAMALDNALLHEEIRLADRQKNDFLSMLAHELRNPLAPIRNAAHLLEFRAGNDPQTKWACEVIDRQVVQMVRLVDDLLDVARITRDKISLLREPIELKSVIDLAVEASRPLIDERKHKLQLSLDESPTWISGDLDRLTQVLTNLLNNAAKFTKDEGQISVSTSREGDEAVIRLRDTGIGIPAAMLDSIFQLFTQVPGTLDRPNGGLGIGLTLVKRLIEKHDGTVEARSDGVGHGSEFIVRLPVIRVPQGERQDKDSDVKKNQTYNARRVLVVDDNQDSANSLALMLRLAGNNVETAYDGLEAIERATSYKPDLILLDIGLPRLNGYEVCRRIREQPDGASTAIVALTGWGQQDDHRRSTEAGFNKHLVKPVDLDVLNDLIANLKSLKAQCLS